MPDNEPLQSSLILYQTEDGRTRIECRFENETIWLTQKLMAELFKKDVRTINEHINNIFAERELAEGAVIRKFRITTADGGTSIQRRAPGRAFPKGCADNTMSTC